MVASGGRVRAFSGKPEDWPEWSITFKSYMVLKKEGGIALRDLIDAATSGAGERESAKKKEGKYDDANRTLFALLSLHVDGPNQRWISSRCADDGVAAWKLLEEKYHGTDHMTVTYLRDELMRVTLDDEDEVEAFVQKVFELAERVNRAVGSNEISDAFKVDLVVRKLLRCASYKDFAERILTSDTLPSFQELEKKVGILAKNRTFTTVGGKSSGSETAAFYVNRGRRDGAGSRGVPRNNAGDECFNCGGRGHHAHQCPSPQKKNGGLNGGNGGKMYANRPFPGECFKCHKKGHKAGDCRDQGSNSRAMNVSEHVEDDLYDEFAFTALPCAIVEPECVPISVGIAPSTVEEKTTPVTVKDQNMSSWAQIAMKPMQYVRPGLPNPLGSQQDVPQAAENESKIQENTFEDDVKKLKLIRKTGPKNGETNKKKEKQASVLYVEKRTFDETSPAITTNTNNKSAMPPTQLLEAVPGAVTPCHVRSPVADITTKKSNTVGRSAIDGGECARIDDMQTNNATSTTDLSTMSHIQFFEENPNMASTSDKHLPDMEISGNLYDFEFAFGGNEESDVEAALHSATMDPAVWLVDSGCTSHVCHAQEMFSSLRTDGIGYARRLEVANGEYADVAGVGEIKVTMTMSTGAVFAATLKNVLYVPAMKHNLFSVRRAVDNGSTISFGRDKAMMSCGPKHDVEVGIEKIGRLYVLRLTPVITATAMAVLNAHEMATLWHRRVGHAGMNTVEKMSAAVTGMDQCKGDGCTCEVCVLTKSKRKSVPKTTTRPAQELWDIVYTDVEGPMQVPGLRGERYVVNFVDGLSGATSVTTMKAKSEVVLGLKRFLVSLGRVPRIIRSDNAQEFKHGAFAAFCLEKGIMQEFSNEYTPEENGVAERNWGTLVGMTRAMLHDAGLPKSFWPLAMQTSSFLLNRIPRRQLEYKTPFEKVHGRVPDVSHLRVWGCVAYVWIEKEKRQKLDDRAWKGIFVGYAGQQKGYIVYNPVSGQLSTSRNVKFEEDVPGGSRRRKPSFTATCT